MTTVTIDVENRSGTKQGIGPIYSAVDVTLERGVSTAGVFNFSMPASDPMAAELSNKLSVVRIYFDESVVFLGVVEAMRRSVDNRGVVWLEVSGRDLLGAEFSETPAGIDDLDDSQIAPYLIRPGGVNPDGSGGGPDWDLKYYSAGWVTYAAGNLTTAKVYGKMWGENCLSAFVKIADRTNEQFVYYPEVDGDRFVRWIGTRWDDSGVRCIQGAGEPVQAESNDNVCFIQSLQKTTEAHEQVTALYVYGAGNANARLTLAAATVTPSGYTMNTATSLINNDAAEATHGWYTKRLEFKEIGPLSNTDADLQAAANYLARVAAAWLDRNATEQTYYDLTVLKLPAAVRPGTQIRVVYADNSLNVDTLFNVIGIQTSMNRDGATVYRLQISDTSQWALSGDGVVASSVERGEVYIAHPQMNANVTVFSYGGIPFDDTTAAELFFMLSESIVQINQIILYYRVDPLRSTVSSSSSAAGGSSSPTSAAGSNHSHAIEVIDKTVPGSARLVYVDVIASPKELVSDITGTNPGTGVSVNTTEGESSHTHTVTIGTHTHTITNTYGLYDDTGSGVVETTAGAEVSINGGADASGSATQVGATPWYQLDMTSALSSATTFRPSAMTNDVKITAGTGAGYRGQVTAHIEIRAVIQAIAYS